MALFGAFFDASGRSDDATLPALFVSGCVSSEKKWLRFESEWLALLTKHRVSRPFRMSKFYADFRDRPTERSVFLRDAVKIIKRRTYKSFSSGVVMSAHQRAAKEYQLPVWIADAYALCSTKVIAQVGIWLRNRDVNGRMMLVFESGDLGSGKLISALEEAKVRVRPNFDSKKDNAAFDPGDLIAWVHARTTRRFLEGRPNDIAALAREIRRQVPGEHRWGIHDEKWFAKHGPTWPRRPA